MTFRIGVIGCGVIGKRRAATAKQLGDYLVIVADIDSTQARQTALENNCEWTTDWREVVRRKDVDIVIASTVNQVLAPVSIAAAQSGKHVLCEKPLGRNATEAQQMVDAARIAKVYFKTGFNHRYHPAIWKAHEIAEQKTLGEPMFIRAVYGHGGRPGYDKEWRANFDLAVGGELLDQGVHIIDLCRWFIGEFSHAFAYHSTYFWDLGYVDPRKDIAPSQVKRQLEDNAFAVLRTESGQIAQFHTSWTQWKNRFSFEVFYREGYLRIEGLGGSYGVESLTLGRRRPESGPPIEETFDFVDPDRSWQAEWHDFTSAIRDHRPVMSDGVDGLATMRIVDALYRSAQSGQFMPIQG